MKEKIAQRFVAQSRAMTERDVVLSTLFIVLAAAGSTAAQSVIENEKFDVEKARVYVATVQPHRPVLASNGHARNRVFIYMDDGVMHDARKTARPRPSFSTEATLAGYPPVVATSRRTRLTARFAFSWWT